MIQALFFATLMLFVAPVSLAQKPDGVPPGHAGKGTLPPGHAKKDGVPPGLAKKGGLPPGLAKKYGRPVAGPVYVALDPARDDRAWFLIEGRWELRERFDPVIRAEVRAAFTLATVPPPVPLPRAEIALRVVLFD